jgi:hypothetical protein
MQRLWLSTAIMLLLFACGVEAHAAQPMWRQFVPKKKVPSALDGDYTLSKENGPWLILAASFSGEGAEQQARDLVLELRKQYGLHSYYYGMTFQMEESRPGRGLDVYGSKIRRRYQRAQIREHAVLVGEFTSLEDPSAQKMLKRVKHLTPDSLATKEGESTSQSLAKVRKIQDYLREKVGSDTKKGLMGHAFLTRNPLLPKEFFVPQGIEEDIAKWNEGLDYTLMKSPGKYSIRVATFKGRTSLKGTNDELEKVRTRKATKDEPLVVAGKNAHLLTVALRQKGWEAYEFHGRHESYVSIGSFNEAQVSEDGRIAVSHRDAQIIINTFGAHTPNNVFNRPALADLQKEAERKQQFNSLFSQGMGKVADGFHPKRFVGLPFDIQPQAVRVPRRSISSVYARK